MLNTRIEKQSGLPTREGRTVVLSKEALLDRLDVDETTLDRWIREGKIRKDLAIKIGADDVAITHKTR